MLLGMLALTSCSKVPNLPLGGMGGGVKPNPPEVSVHAVALISAPGNIALAKYFCPSVANSLLCRVFGSAPAAVDLKFVFDVDLEVQNPNDIPLPAVEAMVGFTAYPDAPNAANVGAVCVALCPEGEVCGPPPEAGCQGGGLRTMDDYAMASVGFLANVAMGNTSVSDLKVRTIPPKGMTHVKIRLELDPIAMLSLMKNVSSDSMASVKKGKQPSFAVPYMLEGTVWVDIQSFGRIAASFGPHNDAWKLAN